MRARGGADDDDDSFYSRPGAVAAETQSLLVAEQDETIRSLASSVTRVQDMALRVNEELASQNRLIGQIDDEVEKTDNSMRSMNSRLRKLAHDKDRGKYCVIVLLIVVLVILTMMVLS